MASISRSQRRSYLLRGKHLSYAFSWCLLPVGFLFSYLFVINQMWKPLMVTLLVFDIPGLFCFLYSHSRFFWSTGKQNKYIKKCIELDQKQSAEYAKSRNNTLGATAPVNSERNKNTNSNPISDLIDNINLSPGQKKAAEFAATYAALKTVQKATNNFGIDLSKSNTEKYNQTIRMPGQSPYANTCKDCKRAKYKDKDHILCDRRGLTDRWSIDHPACQGFVPQK